ncbi:MAG TPA: hypothetical protein VHO03_16740 [Ignavibacteriales bacterium]|nr:hypothetical protein [Ignavibacteriales bacterium]
MIPELEQDIKQDFREMNRTGLIDKEIIPQLAEQYGLSEATIKKVAAKVKTRFYRCKYEGCGVLHEEGSKRTSPEFTDYCAKHRLTQNKHRRGEKVIIKIPQGTRAQRAKRASQEKEPKKVKYNPHKCHENCGPEFEYERESYTCRNCTIQWPPRKEKVRQVMEYGKIAPKVVVAAYRNGNY